MLEMLYVKAGPQVGQRVALWDKSPAHPGPDHEIFVAGSAIVHAAKTPAVAAALQDLRVELATEAEYQDYQRRLAEQAERGAAEIAERGEQSLQEAAAAAERQD